jgi:HSP20 family protein
MSKASSALDFMRRSHAVGVRESTHEAHWVPNTDIYVTEEGLVIRVELAGMRREDLELTVENQKLKISGHRSDGCRTGKCSFVIMEIDYGPFETCLTLPAGYDLSRARASYQNGFLRIDVPEQPAHSEKSVSIDITEE